MTSEIEKRQLFQKSRDRRPSQACYRLLVLVSADIHMVFDSAFSSFWLKQMKVIVTGLQLIFSPAIIGLGNFAMRMYVYGKYRFENYEQVKIVMVMFVVPIILNVLQVYHKLYSSSFRISSSKRVTLRLLTLK